MSCCVVRKRAPTLSLHFTVLHISRACFTARLQRLQHAKAIVLLQTRDVLHHPTVLLELFCATRHSFPVFCVLLADGG